MREILFRGKMVYEMPSPISEWVYGYLSFVYIDNPAKASIYCPKVAQRYDVLFETIGQYTGLLDKNGTKIFEGDILIKPSYLVKAYDYRNLCICKRVERHGVIGLALCDKDIEGKYDSVISSDEWEDFENIGNIHENPELLEVEK